MPLRRLVSKVRHMTGSGWALTWLSLDLWVTSHSNREPSSYPANRRGPGPESGCRKKENDKGEEEGPQNGKQEHKEQSEVRREMRAVSSKPQKPLCDAGSWAEQRLSSWKLPLTLGETLWAPFVSLLLCLSSTPLHHSSLCSSSVLLSHRDRCRQTINIVNWNTAKHCFYSNGVWIQIFFFLASYIRFFNPFFFNISMFYLYYFTDLFHFFISEKANYQKFDLNVNLTKTKKTQRMFWNIISHLPTLWGLQQHNQFIFIINYSIILYLYYFLLLHKIVQFLRVIIVSIIINYS